MSLSRLRSRLIMAWLCAKCLHEENLDVRCQACGSLFPHNLLLYGERITIKVTQPEQLVGRSDMKMSPGSNSIRPRHLRFYYARNSWQVANVSRAGDLSVSGIEILPGRSISLKSGDTICIGPIELRVESTELR